MFCLIYSNKEMSGIGRGRGWLNMNKNTKPGMEELPESSKHDSGLTVSAAGTKIDSKYSTMVSVICKFNESDDGILLNQKLRHFIEVAEVECADSKSVEYVFALLKFAILLFAFQIIGLSYQRFDPLELFFSVYNIKFDGNGKETLYNFLFF